jgi:hypothetical protein
MNTATQSVEVPFPQAFAGPKPRLFPSAPRYSVFLVASDRQSDREVGMRPPRRSYAAYHPFAHEQFETLVLLPTGTIYRGTQRNTIGLSMCERTELSIAQTYKRGKREYSTRISPLQGTAIHPLLERRRLSGPLSVRHYGGESSSCSISCHTFCSISNLCKCFSGLDAAWLIARLTRCWKEDI